MHFWIDLQGLELKLDCLIWPYMHVYHLCTLHCILETIFAVDCTFIVLLIRFFDIVISHSASHACSCLVPESYAVQGWQDTFTVMQHILSTC